jgi:tetratricopeptide (TPR) repeat protein
MMNWGKRFVIVVTALLAVLSANAAFAQRSSPLSENSTINVPFLLENRDTGEVVIAGGDLLPAGAVAQSAPQSEPVGASATANRNSNLRGGPGTNYPIVGNARAGQALRPVGKNAAGTWYLLDNDAWIAAFLVDGAPANLRVVGHHPEQNNNVEAAAPAASAAPAPAQAASTADDSVFDEDPDTVIQEMNAELAQYPNDAYAYTVRGIAYYEKDDYGRALSDLNRAIQLDVGLLDAYIYRSLIYLEQGKYAQAVNDMSLALQIYPDGDAFAVRGLAYAAQGEFGLAIQDLEKALELGVDPEIRADVEEMLQMLRGF